MSVLTVHAKLAPRTLFSPVLVGIDSSEESREAALQATALAEGQLTMLAVYGVRADFGAGNPIGIPVYYDGDLDREAAEDALSRVRDDIAAADPSGKVVRGVVWDALLREAGHINALQLIEREW
ncbi:MAG: universal stress protein [Actinobacteria bacterium]|nr:universal stress protein [Actinomycetota bacterium]